MDEGLKKIKWREVPPIFKKDIEKDIVWVQCPKCKNEYNKLTDTGVCADCETEINKEKELVTEREEKDYLLDKVNKEIKEVKHRADIDG